MQFLVDLIHQLIHLADNSHRVAIRGEELFPPYTQLGWDQSAPPLGSVDVENVSQAENIVGFGRPLYFSFLFFRSLTNVVVMRQMAIAEEHHFGPE